MKVRKIVMKYEEWREKTHRYFGIDWIVKKLLLRNRNCWNWEGRKEIGILCYLYREDVRFICWDEMRWDERSKKETCKSEIWITRH